MASLPGSGSKISDITIGGIGIYFRTDCRHVSVYIHDRLGTGRLRRR